MLFIKLFIFWIHSRGFELFLICSYWYNKWRVGVMYTNRVGSFLSLIDKVSWYNSWLPLCQKAGKTNMFCMNKMFEILARENWMTKKINNKWLWTYTVWRINVKKIKKILNSLSDLSRTLLNLTVRHEGSSLKMSFKRYSTDLILSMMALLLIAMQNRLICCESKAGRDIVLPGYCPMLRVE